MKSQKKDCSYIFILAFFLVVGIVSISLYFKTYQQKDTVNIHPFPKSIQGWSSKELPITEKEYAILETRNAFVRQYTNALGKEAFLYIVYSQYNRKVSHPPELCYTGSGATVLSNVPVKIPINVASYKNVVLANKVLIEKSTTNQVMFYWFKVGDAFTPNYWKQQFLIVIKQLLGKPASSAMIRISVTIYDGDTDTAVKTVEEFAGIITPLLFQYLP